MNTLKLKPIKIMMDTNITGSTPFYLTRDSFYFNNKQRGGAPDLPVAQAVPAPVAQAIPVAQAPIVEGIPDERLRKNNEPESKEQSRYPYFTTNVSLPLADFKKFERSEYIDLFFDRQKFYNFIRNFRRTTDPKEQSINAKHNVIVMLELFFPTSFPIKHNIHSSYDEKIKQTSMETNDSDSVIPDFVLNYFNANPQSFSYLQTGGAKYTIISVTWLNDVVNNPDYNKLIREVYKYTIWEHDMKVNTQNEINKLKKEFNKLWEKCSILFDISISNTRIGTSVKRMLVSIKTEMNIEIQIKKIADLDQYIRENRYSSKDDIPREMIYDKDFNNLLRNSANTKILLDTIEYIEDPSRFPNLFVKKEKNDTEFVGLRDNLLKYPIFMNAMKYILSFIIPQSGGSLSNIGAQFGPSGTVLRETSNLKLQKIITHFINTSSKPGEVSLTEFVKVIADKYLNEETLKSETDNIDVSDFMSTDVITLRNSNTKDAKVDNSSYEIYLEVDVVKGILSSDNIGKLFCKYQGSLLEKMYEQLKYRKSNDITMSKIRPMLDVEVLMRETNSEEDVKRTKNETKIQGGFIPKRTLKNRTSKSIQTRSIRSKK